MATQLDMLQIKINRARDALSKATKKAIDSVDWRAFILSLREKKGYSFEQLEDLELETELLLCGLLDPKDYPKTLEEELKLPKAQIDLLVEEMNKFVFEKIEDELIKNTEREDIFVKKEEPLPNIEPVDNHTMSPNIVKINTSPFLNPKVATEDKKTSPQEIPLPNLPLSKGEEKGESQTVVEIMPKEITPPNIKTNEPNNKERIADALKKELPASARKLEPIKQDVVLNKKDETVKTSTPGVSSTPSTNNTANNNMNSIFSQKLSGSFKLPTTKTDYTVKNTPTAPLSTKIASNKTDPYRELPE